MTARGQTDLMTRAAAPESYLFWRGAAFGTFALIAGQTILFGFPPRKLSMLDSARTLHEAGVTSGETLTLQVEKGKAPLAAPALAGPGATAGSGSGLGGPSWLRVGAYCTYVLPATARTARTGSSTARWPRSIARIF